ncbi:MAG: ABC transporter permease [Arachnia sp.]
MTSRSKWWGWVLAAPPLLVIAIFIVVPISFGVAYTLGYSGGPNRIISLIAQHQYLSEGSGPTIGAYQDVFSSQLFWRSFSVTIIVAVVATVVVMVLAWTIALYLRFKAGRAGQVLSGLVIVPMFIPVVIGSYAMLAFYGTDGFVRTVAALAGWEDAPAFGYTVAGIVIGSVWTSLPFAVLMVTSGLSSVPDALIESAQDVGASAVRRFFSVLLPMALLPTVIAATFTAINILGSFTLPYIVGPSAPNMLGVLMSDTYQAFNQPQQAEVMAVVVFVLASFASVPYLWANFRSAKSSGAFK